MPSEHISAEATVPSKSIHTSDPALQPFLSSSFDAAAYLNANLPVLSSSARGPQAQQLSTLSTQTQSMLAQLSANMNRLGTTLTQLTDEILRSGSRLAYDVEILRGESLALCDALSEGLADDAAKFVPGGVAAQLARRRSLACDGRRRRSTLTGGTLLGMTAEGAAPAAALETQALQRLDTPGGAATEPSCLARLRTLTQVRARLEEVIQTFGSAMDWSFPPSEVSVASSFVSVSAPGGTEAGSLEERGQRESQRLRDEISELLRGDGDGAVAIDGVERAAKRVEELKRLCGVWRGTAEERGRARLVEELARMVEARHLDLLREREKAGMRQERPRMEARLELPERPSSGFGFLSQLQRMRG
jgi:hypothetical protein